MSEEKLIGWIEQDRAALVDLLSRLVQANSQNPPGDTTAAARVMTDYLQANGLDFEIVAPQPQAPNIVAGLAGAGAGPHLVFNGHLDTYPCDDADRWSVDPFGGEVRDGKLYGRGASDMKAGTAAIAAAYVYLARLRQTLRGRLTLTLVSDEETGGRWGAQYLLAHRDVAGDCMLNSEPGAPTTIRFGEKGSLKLRFRTRTLGCHGAYTHKSKSATKLTARLIADLEEIADLPVTTSDNVARLLDQAAAEFDRVHLPGAAKVLRAYTVNIGTISGGVKMNMLPAECQCEVDIRIPIGGSIRAARDKAAEIAARYPEISLEDMSADEPGWSDPDHPLLDALRDACGRVSDEPIAIVTSLGATDARHWRAAGVPCFTYGTTATNVAMADEHTDIEEFIRVLKVHALAAYRYLKKG
jgi:succinyl-diaminopimelate desuccinylase